MNNQTTHDRSAAPGNGIGTAAASGPGSGTTQSALSREYHDFLADVEQLITSATSVTSDDLHNAKARVAAHIASARASVADAGSVVAERARAGAVATDRYVRAQPWQAVGISAVAGMLLGYLFGRRGE